jgi:SSS family solute:Na+ symporter
LFIMIVWVPCILLGIWASTAMIGSERVIPAFLADTNQVLAIMVKKLTNPVVAGLLGVGIVSATMSLDSQFLALSSMFTHDIVVRIFGEQRIGDKQRILLGRSMVVAIVAVAYLLAQLAPRSVFTLGVWCFTGFSGLFPLVFASLYWKRVTSTGAIASILAAAGAWVFLFHQSKWGADKDYLFLGMMPAATIVFSTTAALVLVSLLTRPPANEVVARFFPEDRAAPLGVEIQGALEIAPTPV